MAKKSLLKIYLTTLLVFIAIDALWLGVISKNLYSSAIGHLMGEINYFAVIAFYLVFSFGLTYLIILPGLKNKNRQKTLIRASVFGFVTYATYDLTNLATLKDWPLNVTIIDLVWGSFLSFSTTYLVLKLVKNNEDK